MYFVISCFPEFVSSFHTNIKGKFLFYYTDKELIILARQANVFTKLASTRLYLNDEKAEDFRIKALDIVEDFVKKGSFYSYDKVADLIKYSALSDKEAAYKLGLSDAAYRKHKSRFSSAFYDIVGDNVFDTIMFGAAKEVAVIVNVVRLQSDEYTSEKMFDLGLRMALKMGRLSDEAYDVVDCKPEMTLLHWLSINKRNWLLERVDVDRLCYLLEVLDNKRGTPQDRLTLLRVLCADDPVLHCKPEDKKLFTFPPERKEIDNEG